MKPISTSLFDFKDLVSANYTYIDKTEYVYSLVKEKYQNLYFISRPRRYGKSLMCSTLEYLFKGRRDLFEGLYIAEHTDYDFEEYPVFHFNFLEIVSDDFDSFYQSFQDVVKVEAEKNGISLTLNHPAMMLKEIFLKAEKNVVIIIDEFDSPIVGSIDNRDLVEKMRKAFSSFYSMIKSYTGKIRFLFITGVTKLSNMSIFSQMNNLVDISMDPRFASAFGYTEEELVSNFSEYIDAYLSSEDSPYRNKEDFISDIRDYYDGYRFSPDSDVKVYNPVSIGFFFSEKCRFKNYWETTGVSSFAIELAKHYDLLNIVEDSISVGIAAFTSFDISNIAEKNLNRSSIYALLYYTGYLTIKEGNIAGLRLKFPNKEISSTFTTNLVSRYIGSECDYGDIIFKAREDIEKGDVVSFISVLSEYYESIPYTLLDKNREKSYHLLFHAFFVSLGADVASEDANLRGRSDTVVKNKNGIYIFELKVDGKAESAILQIKDRGYYKKYLALSQERSLPLHLIGLNFSSEKRTIESYKEEVLS